MFSSVWKICHETRHSVYVSQTLGSYDLIHSHPALPASCIERAPVPCDCDPVAMIVGRVATIMDRTVPTSCNQCGPAGAMIAVPSADVCGPLQLIPGGAGADQHARGVGGAAACKINGIPPGIPVLQ